MVPTLSLLLPLGAYGALTAVGVDGAKAGLCFCWVWLVVVAVVVMVALCVV